MSGQGSHSTTVDDVDKVVIDSPHHQHHLHHHPLHQPEHTLSFAYQTFLRNNIDEQSHFNDVCRAYRQYANFAIKQFGLNYPNRIANLPASSQAVLPKHLQYGTTEFQQRLQYCKDATIRNQFVLDCILRHAGQPISQPPPPKPSPPEQVEEEVVYATEAQLSKVTSVLKSLARDWSVEGTLERNMSYQPILQSVRTYLPLPSVVSSTTGTTTVAPAVKKICVPGAGVGRLACELAAMGYTVQGNEFSLYMLLASDFILNGPVVSVSSVAAAAKGPEPPPSPPNPPRPLSISPWLLETRNVHNMVDPFRTVQIPDVDPFDMVISAHLPETLPTEITSNDTSSKLPPMGSDFSMTAGDFTSIYSVESEANAWDGVVSCFFLDASPNIVEYLQTIHHMLKPNGILINFGPLHWHWSGPAMLLTDETMSDYYDRYDHLDKKYLQSYDYCWEDIQTILQNIGFTIIEQTNGIPAHYTADPRSMIQTEYRCIHFVAQKNGTAGSGES